jgi:hypothetical protein
VDVTLPVDIMHYYKEPLKCTVYMIKDSLIIQQQSTVRNGKAVPARYLPILSQLLQLTQEEDGNKSEVPTFIESTQAYNLIYPKFKQICLVSDRNSRILSMAMGAMRDAHIMVLMEQTGDSGSTSTSNQFTSSNLELDMHVESRYACEEQQNDLTYGRMGK